jgi:hypothetical protein
MHDLQHCLLHCSWKCESDLAEIKRPWQALGSCFAQYEFPMTTSNATTAPRPAKSISCHAPYSMQLSPAPFSPPSYGIGPGNIIDNANLGSKAAWSVAQQLSATPNTRLICVLTFLGLGTQKASFVGAKPKPTRTDGSSGDLRTRRVPRPSHIPFVHLFSRTKPCESKEATSPLPFSLRHNCGPATCRCLPSDKVGVLCKLDALKRHIPIGNCADVTSVMC